uniref:Transketolase-like pyrimidine-binding domain-containing protein n=1 Tax=Timema shepardi TaxID=629360 RepID=A0A7R9AS37_TIMSH|nr:unnamed protein product [Timema shepardi]
MCFTKVRHSFNSIAHAQNLSTRPTCWVGRLLSPTNDPTQHVLALTGSPNTNMLVNIPNKKRSYIGKLKFSNFDAAPNGKRVFLATEENVVAALNLKSGDILWRHVLEKGSEGVIRFLSVDTDVVTVSGDKDTLLVRGWDPSGGILQWEWPLPKTDHRVEDTHWYMSGSKLYQVIPVALSHVEVTVYNVGTGGKISAHSVPAKWIADTSKCILTTSYLACVSTTLDGKTLFGVLDVMDSEEEAQFWSKPLSEFIGKTPLGPTLSVEPVPGPVPAVIMKEAAGNNARYLVYLSPKGPQLFPKVLSEYTSVVTVVLEGQHVLLQASHSADVVEITAHVLETGETISDLVGSTHASPLGPSSLAAAVCSPRRDKGPCCKILISLEDHAIALLLHPGKLVWVREEALSSIVAVEMLELPVSDTDAAIEQEFDHKETGILGMFVHRISSQIIQLRSSLMALLGDRMSEGQSSGLVRDEFGLHKIIVAATASGKMVMKAACLAVEYQRIFRKEVFVNMNCYRQWGHNELDDPTFTNPALYRIIHSRRTVPDMYAAELVKLGVLTNNDVANIVDTHNGWLNEELKKVDTSKPEAPAAVTTWDTGVEQQLLRYVAARSVAYPHNFNIHPHLLKTHVKGRLNKLTEGSKIDWSTAEAMAFGSLMYQVNRVQFVALFRFFLSRYISSSFMALPSPLFWISSSTVSIHLLLDLALSPLPTTCWTHFLTTLRSNTDAKPKALIGQESAPKPPPPLKGCTCKNRCISQLPGFNVRISGQDVGRGTFSQRHAMLVDQVADDMYIPLNDLLDDQAGHLEVVNSNLSEEAVLGFEYGMSIENPNNLIIWEAQFGDFFTGAQIIVDTFITSGETKWMMCTGLVMLLPHGYDGAGPEHSSCRLERLLQLSDSSEVLPDGEDVNIHVANPTTPAQYFHLLRGQASDVEVVADKVRRVILVSGKHYYALHKHRRNLDTSDIAIVRLEGLSPFPTLQLQQELAKYKRATSQLVVCLPTEPIPIMAENLSLVKCGSPLSH